MGLFSLSFFWNQETYFSFCTETITELSDNQLGPETKIFIVCKYFYGGSGEGGVCSRLYTQSTVWFLFFNI